MNDSVDVVTAADIRGWAELAKVEAVAYAVPALICDFRKRAAWLESQALSAELREARRAGADHA